jgi:DNA-binding GntR family transcriptional regulator
MTQIELAAAAGTVKEVVNRALAELEDSGAILRDGGHIVKLDRDKLVSEVSRG